MKIKKKMKCLNLNTERVEDHLINGGHIEVKDCEVEILEPGYHLYKLLGSPPCKYFEVGMAFNHGHFDICYCGAVLSCQCLT